MITNSIQKHTGYYFSLIIILALGIFLSLQTSGDRQLQMLIMVMTVFFYVAWGILHHLLEHDLNIKIVIEYVLIGSLAMSIVLFLVRG